MRASRLSRARRLLSRAFDLLARRRRDADLDDEIAAHLDLAAEEQRARGFSDEQARAAATRSFGGVVRAKEAYRDGRGFPLVDAVLQDLRFAIRGFRKTPTFTAVAILTLALALGANTAIFSIVYGALIKPLPYRDADRLVLIQGEYDITGEQAPAHVYFSLSQLPDWQARLKTAEAVALFAPRSCALSTRDGLQIVDAAVVSGTFFSTLGGRFDAGRPLAPSDSAEPRAVISWRLAQHLFPQPSDAAGAHVVLDGRPYTIVGVADPSLQFPSSTVDVWLPARYERTFEPLQGGLLPIVRVKLGITLEQARADIAAAARVLPPTNFERVRTSVIGLRDHLVGARRPAVLILWATVVLLLLVASANLVNLFLARNAARAQETAIRMALGASRGRLLLRDLIDSALISIGGTLAGIALAMSAIDLVARWNPTDIPALSDGRLNAIVLGFAVLLGGVTALALGALSATQSARTVPVGLPGFSVARPGGRRLRRVICTVELAMAIVLLVGGLLLGRSLVRLLHIDIGVNPDHVTTASLSLDSGTRHSDEQKRQLVDDIVSRIAALPGVRSVGLGAALPPNLSGARITMRGSPDAPEGYAAEGVPSTPGYLRALGVRLLQGRFFTAGDDENQSAVVILSKDTAQRFFGRANPLGRTFNVPTLLNGRKGNAKATVVGIIADVKYAGLTVPADDQVYEPFAQQPWSRVFLAVRTDGDPPGFSSTVRRAVASVDPTIVLSSVQTLDTALFHLTAPARFRTLVLVSFAGLALAISAVGLYGVIAYSVAQRTMEIGIRMALGARTADVMRMVLREGAVLGIVGVAIGLAAAYGVTRLLASLLYGVTATDPISFALAAVILLAVALAASYLPARRAARVDPLVALRTE